jgi:hypothetical protein
MRVVDFAKWKNAEWQRKQKRFKSSQPSNLINTAKAETKSMKKCNVPIKNKKICREFWDSLPFTSEHIFKTDGSVHNNITVCEKCGKSIKEWEDEVLKKIKGKKFLQKEIKTTKKMLNLFLVQLKLKEFIN